MPWDVKALEEQIAEIVSQAGREFYAPAFSSSILVGLVKPFILPLFPLQLTINERQPAAPSIPICPMSLEWKAARGAFWERTSCPPECGRLRVQLPVRLGLSAPRRNELGTAWRYRVAWEGKSAITRASSPGRRGDRSPDESENANTGEVNLNRRIFSGVGAATTCCYFSRSQAPNIAMKCRCVREAARLPCGRKNRSGIPAASIFHLSKLRYGISALSKNRQPNLVAIPRASRKTEWPGRNRPGHSKQTSPLLSSIVDGAQRSAVLPRRRRAALPLSAPERYRLRHWRSRRVDPHWRWT